MAIVYGGNSPNSHHAHSFIAISQATLQHLTFPPHFLIHNLQFLTLLRMHEGGLKVTATVIPYFLFPPFLFYCHSIQM